jgi:Domain of unknown function (DUF6457)
MDAWLTKARDALAAEAGVDAAELDLADADAETLLKLARLAAHTSGDRTNAPLVCYLVGRAQGARDVAALADAVRRSTS